MANVSGSPSPCACLTSGFSALGSSEILPFHSVFNEMAWPFRFNSQGMIIGFFGEPASPMVEAMGMPMSMCVTWMVPLLKLRSEEHTSELQSLAYLVCRLLLEKKKKKQQHLKH